MEVDSTHSESGANSSGNDSLAELKESCAFTSTLIALLVRTSSCDIHEKCDGSCGNVVNYQENPLIGLEGLMLFMLAGLAGNQTSATTQDVPRDTDWLEQQHFSSLVYSPINGPEGEIRLLKLKEALFRADVLECDLITTSLGQCEDFKALSYCWGSNELNEVMLCNGKIHYISASLNAALKATRESPKTRGCLLWADAVSIDQSNESEKSEQIPLMRRIYTEADACFVYLGEGERLVTQGLDLMLRLSTLQDHLKTPENHGSVSTDEVRSLLPPLRHTAWTEYMRIFTSPWFCRTWTLQEIALSEEALLGIGRYVLDWKIFEKSVDFLREQDLLASVGPRPAYAMPGTLRFMKIREIKKISNSPNPSSALIGVLRATRHFKVTDPRDKIFAVLGLVGDLSDELKSMVDYKLSTGVVYHRAALWMLQNPDPLQLLAHAGLQRQSGLFDIPSWVPDWYSDDKDRNELPLMLFRPENFRAGGKLYMFKIKDGTAPPSRELSFLGFCHHRITLASNPYKYPKSISDPTFSMSELCYAWLDSARACLQGSSHLIYDDIEDAFARTLLVNDLYNGVNALKISTAIENPKETFRAAIMRMEDARSSEDPEGAFYKLCTMSEKNDQVQTFIMQMTAAMRGRRFAITGTGYTCLVPACAEIGDAVAIFFGHPTPFTIRLEQGSEQSGNRLERVRAILVGDTYMHGAMEGEWTSEVVETERKPCEIVLI
ncbi:MAG: hypothetical protein Q9225_006205 [Loekoesia sp. 1 TL-2023]